MNKPLLTIYKYLIGFFSVIIFLTSCNDKIKENLTSTLLQNVTEISTTEGGYLTFTIGLQKALSKDLLLRATFNLDSIIAYINDDDYTKALEYSSDGGQNWLSETDKTTVRLKAGKTSISIRIQTIDDSQIEFTESFKINLTHINSNEVELTNSPEEISCEVYDDDILTIDNDKTNPYNYLMVFSIDNVKSTYRLIGIKKEKLSDIKAKKVFDEDYKEILRDVLAVLKLTPNIKTGTFELIYDSEAEFFGYVHNENSNEGSGADDWTLALNVFWAYNAYVGNSYNTKTISYNQNGEFGFTLVHEYGHILTLNYYDQIEDTRADYSHPCSEYLVYEGCSKPNSHLNRFYENFYEDTTINSPTHVSDYATTNVVEDLAETFAFYVAQENIPTSTANSSGALQKINFIGGRSLANLKTDFRKIIKPSIVYPLSEIFARLHLHKKGKMLSCRERYEAFLAKRRASKK